MSLMHLVYGTKYHIAWTESGSCSITEGPYRTAKAARSSKAATLFAAERAAGVSAKVNC